MTESELRTLMQHQPDQGRQALFETYYHYVYAIAFRRINGIGTHEDVEECVIDVFLEIFARFDTIGSGSLKSYIGTVTRNMASNVCRYLLAKSRKTEPLDEEAAVELPSAEDVAASAEQAELQHRLLQSIDALGEPDSVILIQKFYYGRSAGEIARIIGKSPAFVRNRCSRALKRLRTAFSDYGKGGDQHE